MAAVKLLNLPKVELGKPLDANKALDQPLKVSKISRKKTLYALAGLSVMIGMCFAAAGLSQSDGCTAGMFVIKEYREDALSKSYESELVQTSI